MISNSHTKTCEISMAGTGMWENIGACLLFTFTFHENGGGVKFINFLQSLMVSLYWNCCWILPKDDSAKVTRSRRPCNVCLSFMRLRVTVKIVVTMKIVGFLMVVYIYIYMMESAGLIFLTKDIYDLELHNPANMPWTSILCLVKTPKTVQKGTNGQLIRLESKGLREIYFKE